MNPPPPRFPAAGWVTASANPVATAASTAFPPFFRMARPTLDAMGSTDTTAPFGNDTIPAGGFASCNEAAMPNANTKNVEQKRIFLIRRNYTLASRRRGLYARIQNPPQMKITLFTLVTALPLFMQSGPRPRARQLGVIV